MRNGAISFRSSLLLMNCPKKNRDLCNINVSEKKYRVYVVFVGDRNNEEGRYDEGERFSYI